MLASTLSRLVVMGLLLPMPKSIFRLCCIVWCCRAGWAGRAVLLRWWGYILSRFFFAFHWTPPVFLFSSFFCFVFVCFFFSWRRGLSVLSFTYTSHFYPSSCFLSGLFVPAVPSGLSSPSLLVSFLCPLQLWEGRREIVRKRKEIQVAVRWGEMLCKEHSRHHQSFVVRGNRWDILPSCCRMMMPIRSARRAIQLQFKVYIQLGLWKMLCPGSWTWNYQTPFESLEWHNNDADLLVTRASLSARYVLQTFLLLNFLSVYFHAGWLLTRVDQLSICSWYSYYLCIVPP